MNWLSAILNLFSNNNQNNGSDMGMSAANKSAADTAQSLPMTDRVSDMGSRYSAGQNGSMGGFFKDIKGGNYMGALGYGSKLLNSAGGAQPAEIIKVPEAQTAQVPDYYSRIYNRYRGLYR